MYGFINHALERLLKRSYGDEKWDEIREKASVDLEGSSFKLRTIYEDEATDRLLKAAIEVIGIDYATLLQMFGEEFFAWCRIRL
eukprot:m.7111 g.7111  ORF g.7111 m.7111 type:complete len:84 (+) comp17805_c0_seq1:163-414(+)